MPEDEYAIGGMPLACSFAPPERVKCTSWAVSNAGSDSWALPETKNCDRLPPSIVCRPDSDRRTRA